ncbi:hypothetical protein [Vibrio parahaemolyticus]|uniref:hypothetical protein n=2 Tax=Vibrio parahaemolyticus TaxID=670 RepID=UPI003D9CB30F
MKPSTNNQVNRIAICTSKRHYPNNLGDHIWHLEDEDGKIKEVDFLEWDCSDDKVVWAQSFILKRADGYVNNEQKLVISDLGTWKPIINKLQNFCEYWEYNLKNTPLSRWTQHDVVQFIKNVMIYIDKDGNECVKHHGQEEGYRHILYRSYQYFTNSSIMDGLRIIVSKRLTEVILEPYLKKSGTTLAAWLKGGSFGSIPIENSMVVMAHAIELLQSNQANAVRAFYNFIRNNQSTNPMELLSTRANLFPENRNETARAKNPIGPSKENIKRLKNILEDKLGGESPSIFVQSNLGNFVDELYGAASYILLVLSGFRLSEWVTFKAKDFKKTSDNAWEFCNEIHKTNHSIKSSRYLHGMAALALDCLIECSYVDKISENVPVFLKAFRAHMFVTKHKKIPTYSDMIDLGYWGGNKEATIRIGFQKFYCKTIQQHPELANIHNTTSPHQARHLWAEYTIRRFDGAVIDLITEHFRHRHSDNFIKAYYEDALRERERDDIELSYIEEILRRIGSCNESLPGFFGAAAKRARNELRKAALISFDDFEFAVASLTENIVITVDEWGYCLLRKGEEQLAKCWNKDLGVAMVEELRSFNVCGGCIHSCNTKLQRDGIERSLIAHEEFVEKLPLELSRLADASRKHIRIGKIRLGEMGDE